MNKAFPLSFTLLFLINVYIISATEASGKDVVISQRDIYFAENEEFSFNGSEIEAGQAYECRCENGKCMRVCDLQKIRPCNDGTMVCVCDPQFARTDPFVCKYCDCGEGRFNCTFERTYITDYWKKNCICTEGYIKNGYTGECTAECNYERPCKHGGICWKQECICLSGTAGTFCEEILFCSHCENSLEVDCLYDERQQMSYCSCKDSSLFYDYDKKKCITCPCGKGDCVYEKISLLSRKLKCDCYPGYTEFKGQCKECDCGFGGQCEFDDFGRKICNCIDGFFERERKCLSCQCMNYGDMVNKCEVTGVKKRCFCPEGYEDVLGHCEDINECEKNNTCHPSATCYNLYGSFECQCPKGYKGQNGGISVKPGEMCEDIDECTERVDVCSFSSYVRCVNLPGTYKCECKPGYEPYSYKVQPQDTSCKEASKAWTPALIVIFTSIFILGVTATMRTWVRKRAARRN